MAIILGYKACVKCGAQAAIEKLDGNKLVAKCTATKDVVEEAMKYHRENKTPIANHPQVCGHHEEIG
jgi:hypothetical protein